MDSISIPLPNSHTFYMAMPDSSISMGQFKVSLLENSIDLVKEAELYSSGLIPSPDGKVSSTFSNLATKNVGIGRLHFAIQALSLRHLCHPYLD
jgi:hypothetical protein